jgi:hypothetical protein
MEPLPLNDIPAHREEKPVARGNKGRFQKASETGRPAMTSAERMKAARLANPEHHRAIWRAYYHRNRDRLLLRKKLRQCGIDPNSVPM